jgi:hypothetical protein
VAAAIGQTPNRTLDVPPTAMTRDAPITIVNSGISKLQVLKTLRVPNVGILMT